MGQDQSQPRVSHVNIEQTRFRASNFNEREPFMGKEFDKDRMQNVVSQQELEIKNKLEQARIQHEEQQKIEEEKLKAEEELNEQIQKTLDEIKMMFEQNHRESQYEKCKDCMEEIFRKEGKCFVQYVNQINKHIQTFGAFSTNGYLSWNDAPYTHNTFKLYSSMGYDVKIQISHSKHEHRYSSETAYFLTILPKEVYNTPT